MSRERFKAGDAVTKGNETGKVVELESRRTGAKYLAVWILSGPRKNQREFPEKGWRVDDGRTAEDPRPDQDTEDYIGSDAWKTRHHTRGT